MFELISELFSYPFIVRAVIVGILVSLCASLLGVSLVLKRYSMIGDGLSHVGFGSLAIATAVNAAPLSVSVPVVVLAAFLLLKLTENSRIKGDAAIALISTSSLAIGVIVISLTTGMNTDVCNYMFGSILAMSKNDVRLSIVLSIVMLFLYIVFYHKIFAVTFDETFAKATGTNTDLYNMLIALLTAITIVLGMRIMGVLLISSLIIFPALTSMRLCKKFITVTISSAAVSVVCFFSGIVISYEFATPTGASIVMVNIAAFIAYWILNLVIRRVPIKMKKILPLFLILSLLLTSCGGNSDPSSPDPGTDVSGINTDASSGTDVSCIGADASGSDADPSDIDVDITEKMYVAYINEIYVNTDDYIGKMIRIQGMFQAYTDENTGNIYYYVYRTGPGCCGNDGAMCGFEFTWDGDIPKDNDWIEVVGCLRTYEEDGWTYLTLDAKSVTVMDVRGAETVYQ